MNKIPPKIDTLLALQTTDLQVLLDRDEISRCLRDVCSEEEDRLPKKKDTVRRFAQKQASRDILDFLHHRMKQLLRLEFQKHQDQVSFLLRKKNPDLLQFLESISPFPAWTDYERSSVQKILLFFRDCERTLPPVLKHIDQQLPSFDPSVCMVCCTGNYVLQDSEGFLVCTNPKCRHQAANLVESRITYGTGYSNELSWTQNKSVTLHEPLPAVSLFLGTTATATATSSAQNTVNPQLLPVGLFAPYPALPGSTGFPNSSHERWLHFCDCTDAFRGIFTECLSREIVSSAVDTLANEHNITLIRDLQVPVVRDTLKHLLNTTIHPPQVHFLMHVMGFQFPQLSKEEFELASFLFQRTEQLWPVFAAPNCCFSHSFVISRIFQLLDREDIAAFFPYAKEGVRNETFTKVFQQITGMLDEKSTFYSNLPMF